jgi:hypothetical protein
LEANTYFLSQNVENLLHEYSADGEEIVHLYDFSHLMKCVRNLLLYEDLQYIQDGEEKVASWSNIIRIYEMDKSQFSKLTDEHVILQKLKKIKVKNCSQVFSHSLASAMYSAAKASTQLVEESEFYLNSKATETADLLLFF